MVLAGFLYLVWVLACISFLNLGKESYEPGDGYFVLALYPQEPNPLYLVPKSEVLLNESIYGVTGA